jgi:hypothetical protein
MPQRHPVYLPRFIGKVALDWESGWPTITLTAADDNTSILKTMTFTFTYDGAGSIDTHIDQTYKP